MFHDVHCNRLFTGRSITVTRSFGRRSRSIQPRQAGARCVSQLDPPDVPCRPPLCRLCLSPVPKPSAPLLFDAHPCGGPFFPVEQPPMGCCASRMRQASPCRRIGLSRRCVQALIKPDVPNAAFGLVLLAKQPLGAPGPLTRLPHPPDPNSSSVRNPLFQRHVLSRAYKAQHCAERALCSGPAVAADGRPSRRQQPQVGIITHDAGPQRLRCRSHAVRACSTVQACACVEAPVLGDGRCAAHADRHGSRSTTVVVVPCGAKLDDTRHHFGACRLQQIGPSNPSACRAHADSGLRCDGESRRRRREREWRSNRVANSSARQVS